MFVFAQVKLFREWSAKWPEDFKIELKEKVLEIDPTFEERLCAQLNGVCNGGINDDNVESDAVAAVEPQRNGHHENGIEPSAVVQPLLVGGGVE